MAKELGLDASAYEREYNNFMTKLKKFHDSKGTPFRRLPWLGGQFLDLFLLYKKVTDHGGWVKVTEDKKWRDIAEFFNLPSTCTNAAFALRQHYARYLEAYERINFFGEDAEDVLASGRPNTPISMAPYIAPEYTQSIIPKDENRNFEKLVLSLQCGLPNEVDFAINICMLLSNVSNSVFNLTKAPAVIDMLLAHVGVFGENSQSLKDVYKEWYQKTDRDFIKFWMETIEEDELRALFCESKDQVESVEDDRLFNDGKKYGASSIEAQRVAQVCMILYNFSFDSTNAEILASHTVCLRFLMMGICSRLGNLQNLAWNTLSNLAEKMKLDPIESNVTQVFFQVMHHFLNDNDRFRVIKAMDVLAKLCTCEENDTVMENGLEVHGYESLIRILIIPDIQLVIGSLEALYNISGVGQVTSDQIAGIHHSVDTLVCMVTLDVDFFGPKALSAVTVIENRISAPLPPIPRTRPAMTPPPISPTTGPPKSPAPTRREEMDAESFTFKWLKSTYENYPNGSVSRIDLYADYLSSCSRLARIGILNATSFNRIVKMAFPDAQLRRFPSGNQLQYALVGVRRKPNQQVPSTINSTMSPGTQDHSRTPTPPMSVQNAPSWNQSPRLGMSPARPPVPAGQYQGTPRAPLNQAPVRRPFMPGQGLQQMPGLSGSGQGTPDQSAGMAHQMRTRNQQMMIQQRQRMQQNLQQQGQQQTPQRIAPAPPNTQNMRQTPTPPMPPKSPHGSPGLMAAQQNSGGQSMPQHQVMQMARQQMPGMVQQSTNNPRVPAMSGFPLQRPAQLPVMSTASMQSPVQTVTLPGAVNMLPPGAPLRPYQARPLRPDMAQTWATPMGQSTQGPNVPGIRPGMDGAQRGTTPQGWQQAPSTTAQVRPGVAGYPTPQEAAAGFVGRSYMQPIAPKPMPVPSSSVLNTNMPRPSLPNHKPSSDGVVLIAREERAEDVVSTDLLQNSEEQRIVVVENSNRRQNTVEKNSSASLAGSNGHVGSENGSETPPPSTRTDSSTQGLNNTGGKGGLKRDVKALQNSSDGQTNKAQHNGHDNPKKARLGDQTNDRVISPPTLPCSTDVTTPLVNGGVRTDSKSKLMDKLLGNDLHMPLNGVCDINSTDLDLIPGEGERLSGSNSKSSSPDLFENNSDFGKYLEEGDTDTGLFSDVLSGDLRIDPVELDSEEKGKDTEGQVPSLPDLGYDAVAQELRNQTNSVADDTFGKSLGVNVKAPIPSVSSASQTQPGPNEMVLSRYGDQPRYPVRGPNPEGVWNGPVKSPMVSGTIPGRPPTAQTASEILEHRTRALVTPKASVMEPQDQTRGQQATPQVPMGLPAVSAHISPGPMAPAGTPPPATPLSSDGTGPHFKSGPSTPSVETVKPFQCRWEACASSFDDSKQLFGHVVSAHVSRDSLTMSCAWENCAPVRRSRSSLLFHLQQKHMEPTPVTTISHPPQAAQAPPTTPAPQTHNPSPFPAYHLLARMLNVHQEEDESPLTKTIRLTAALVLRNIAQYSATARSLLRRHERHLSEVAMSGSEAAHAVAACLSELSPHRKTSQSDGDNFIWTLNG